MSNYSIIARLLGNPRTMGEKLLHAPDFGAVYAGKAESIGETLQTASP